MRRTFWLLDLNHESYEGKSSIWLWGITHEGKRVLVIDNNYRAYFYLLPRKEQDPEELKKKLEAERPHPTIENATNERKKLLADERAVPKEKHPRVDLFSFSLLSISKIGAPSAIRDPVQVVSWRTNKDAKEVVLTQTPSDESTIQRFGEDVTKINPDFVLSFEGNSVHWPYLVKRANKTKTPLRVGRDGGPPHQSLYGHYSLIGRANVDLLNF